MKKLKIQVVSKTPEVVDGLLSYWGCISIGEFTERFVMPIDSWTIEEYQQQWKHGLEKIKISGTSCLVTTVQNLKINPLIELWPIYKRENQLFIQQELLTKRIAKEYNLPDLSIFSFETCYQFVDPVRKTVTEDGEKISEWRINIDDI